MEHIDFTQATWLRDLIWYDGPLLCEYELDGKTYLMAWVDVAALHTWLIIEVRPGDLQRYLDQEITLLNLERRSPAIYMHAGLQLDAIHAPKIDFEDIPEAWLPTDESFFIA